MADAPSAPSPAAAGIAIVLEGLDGVGKSTLVAALAKRLNAATLKTPPESMEPFRARFTKGSSDSIVRRTFYDIGNYMAGHDMQRITHSGKHVIIDRWYASTVCYVLGQSQSPLPERGADAYSWPHDLPKPDLMILLTVSEAERLRRRGGRTEVAETDEEVRLREKAALREAINEAFRRFGCIEVSADGDVEDILSRIMGVIEPHLKRLSPLQAQTFAHSS